MATFRILFHPGGEAVDMAEGQTLLEAIDAAQIKTYALCSGQGICGQCKVHVTQGDAPVTQAEHDALSDDELKQGLRLACQFRIASDVTCRPVPD